MTALRCAMLVLLAAFVAGCSSGLSKTDAIDLTQNSIAVVEIQFKNAYRPDYTPRQLGLVVKARGKDGAIAGQFQRVFTAALEEKKSSAVFVMPLPPGSYDVVALTGSVRWGLILGSISTQVRAPFQLGARQALHLGCIDLTNVERTDSSDQATGFSLPLIDQALAGMSGGTLKIRLSGAGDQDLEKMKSDYVGLQRVELIRAPLDYLEIQPSAGSSGVVRRAVRDS